VITEHSNTSSTVNNERDLEIGNHRSCQRDTTTSINTRLPKSFHELMLSSLSTQSKPSVSSNKSSSTNREPRTMSFLTELFWTKTNSNDEEKTSDKGACQSSSSSSSSSSLSLQRGHIVGMERTSNSYHSDTSTTTRSSSDEELPHQLDNYHHHQGRHTTTIPQGQITRRQFLAMISDESSRRKQQQQLPPLPHIQLWAHGKFWTIIGIVATVMGFIMSYQTSVSTAFVSLKLPLYVDPVWDEVTEIGMINLKLCYNTTLDPTTVEGCTVHQLTSQEIDDIMIQTSRSMACLAVLLGGFLSFFLISALFWRSINLRPIGLGYLMTYFMQSFTFLFFDADLCTVHTCAISVGGKYSALASLCWIVSCIAAARMDQYKFQKSLEWMQSEQQEEDLPDDFVESSTSRKSNSRRSKSNSRRSNTSRSRSPTKGSPQNKSKRNKKILQRRTTDGTSPLSDDSFESSDDVEEDDTEGVEMVIAKRRKCPETNNRTRSSSFHSGRRFASNGCEIIQGIQDRKATEAWAARSSNALSPSPGSTKASSSSAKSNVRSNQKRLRANNLTIVTNDVHDRFMNHSCMSPTNMSVGSPIHPPTRNHLVAIRTGPTNSSPSKPGLVSSSIQLDHSGRRRYSPTHKNMSPSSHGISPSGMLTPTSHIVESEEATPRALALMMSSRMNDDIARQLDELDVLVQRATMTATDTARASARQDGNSLSLASEIRDKIGKRGRPSSRSRPRTTDHGDRRSTAARLEGSPQQGQNQSCNPHHHHRRRAEATTPTAFSSTTTIPRRSLVFDFLEDNYDDGRRQGRSDGKSERRDRDSHQRKHTKL
jgi:hypothetical protein